MDAEQTSEKRHHIVALWVGLIVESLVLIALQGYNIYEIRRNSELVQSKINGLAEYSSQQGEKLDRMTTTLELYVGEKFKLATKDEPDSEPKVEQAKSMLGNLRLGKGTQTDDRSESADTEE